MSRTPMVLAAVAAATVASQQLSHAAYYFESRTTTEGAGMGRGGEVIGVHAWVDGERARIEFIEGARSGIFSEGSYLLTVDGGELVYLVDPDEMTYAELNLDDLFAMVGSIMDATGGAVEMEFTDVTSEQVSEGPGGEILGYPTTRYEFHTGYTMTIRMLGFGRSQRSDSAVEVWCTEAIDAEGFRVWLRPDRFRTGNEEFDNMIQAQYQGIDCLPLRSVSTTESNGRGGGTVVSTTEVTVLREEGSLDAALFELPSGYEAVSLIPEDLDLSELSEAIDAAATEAEAADAEEEDEGGPFRRLRGVFDR